MRITKLGHCCLLIEEGGLRILTDPGSYTTTQNHLTDLDIILITHEHSDHLHLESLTTLLKINPGVKIFTNHAVEKILEEHEIGAELLEHGGHTVYSGVTIEAFGNEHAEIYDETIPRVVNSGYFISDKFFYPGDAFTNPGKPVEVLALPVAGPWVKIKEAIGYGREIHPKIAFPVHDGMLKFPGGFHQHPKNNLASKGIDFIVIEEGHTLTV